MRADMKGQFDARVLANVAYGAAGVCKSVSVGKFLGELFAAISKEGEWRLDEFNAQDLANTGWAFATVGQQDEQLFKALAKMAERRLDQFNAQELANTAWAFKKAGIWMPELMQKFYAATSQLVEHSYPEDLLKFL